MGECYCLSLCMNGLDKICIDDGSPHTPGHGKSGPLGPGTCAAPRAWGLASAASAITISNTRRRRECGHDCDEQAKVECLADSSHGGKAVSGFLQANLARIIETVTPDDIQPTIESTVEIGGYFKRWRGGALKRWTDWSHDKADMSKDTMTVDERLTLAFLKVSNPINTAVLPTPNGGKKRQPVTPPKQSDFPRRTRRSRRRLTTERTGAARLRA